jgi:hypothetical protein
LVASRNYRNKCRRLRNPANPTTITTSQRTPNVDLTWVNPIAARKLSNHGPSRITLRHNRQLEIVRKATPTTRLHNIKPTPISRCYRL